MLFARDDMARCTRLGAAMRSMTRSSGIPGAAPPHIISDQELRHRAAERADFRQEEGYSLKLTSVENLGLGLLADQIDV